MTKQKNKKSDIKTYTFTDEEFWFVFERLHQNQENNNLLNQYIWGKVGKRLGLQEDKHDVKLTENLKGIYVRPKPIQAKTDSVEKKSQTHQSSSETPKTAQKKASQE